MVVKTEGLWLAKNKPKEDSEVEPNEPTTKDKTPGFVHASIYIPLHLHKQNDSDVI